MMSVKVGKVENSVFIDNDNIKIVYNGFSHPDLIRKDMESYVNGLLIQLHGEKE